jgi:anti-anti-sigma factor
MSKPRPPDDFTFETHGDITVIVPSPALENMDPTIVTEAAELLAHPLRELADPLVVVDLLQVPFFGSAFLSLLLKCWNVTTAKGGQMVLCNVSERARELLHMTSLDMVWPIYLDRREAFEALLSD